MKEEIEELIRTGRTFTFHNNSYNAHHGTYGRPSEDLLAWIASIEDYITENFGIDSAPNKLYRTFELRYLEGYEQGEFDKSLNILIASLKSCLLIKPKNKILNTNRDEIIYNIFNKFHSIIIQLRKRYDGRPTLDVSDEYDVQDLLHCLLKLHFNDIRKEEWTPSYAGGSSRMDFLLKEEQVVIEVKKTRNGLSDAELGKQLIIDKARYKSHPNCKKLICFTYDPEGRIINPNGILNDLNSFDNDFQVEIVIKPDN